MNAVYEKLMNAYAAIRDRLPFQPKVGLVLGSGLGDYAESEHFRTVAVIPYSEIPGFPVSTAPGHKGRYVFGYVGDVPVVCMQGRVHCYEGYPVSDVVLPQRLMKLMGAETLFLTNAAGGCKDGMEPGCLMLYTDHIACLVPSPLVGANIPELGPRFPDMSHVYDPALRDIVKTCARELDIDLTEGIFCQFVGPCYETPAEVQMAKRWGADAVGMSTAIEAQAAVHMGMRVVAIACITNLAAGISHAPIDEQEVIDMGKRVSYDFSRLVTAIVQAI